MVYVWVTGELPPGRLPPNEFPPGLGLGLGAFFLVPYYNCVCEVALFGKKLSEGFLIKNCLISI